jgi:hypothetical protein
MSKTARDSTPPLPRVCGTKELNTPLSRVTGRRSVSSHIRSLVMRTAPQVGLTVEQSQEKADDSRDMAYAATRLEPRIMLHHIAETWDRIAADVRLNRPDNQWPRF